MDEIMNLIDELEEIMTTSRSVPFSSKVTVDKDEILDIIDEMRKKIPGELKNAKWIIDERNKILIDAQKEADEITKGAENRMNRLIDEHEVTKKAYEQAAEIIESSKKNSKEMRLGANEYADEMLAATEQKLREMMERVHEQSVSMDNFFNESLEIVYENRQELRGGKK